MNKIIIGEFERISKPKARKLYIKNKQFTIVPCKVSPLNSWGLGMEVQQNNWSVGENFNQFVRAFEYYNCNNELGKYSAFYVKSE